MLSFKKNKNKITNIRKDFQINIESSILRNSDIEDSDIDGEKVMMNLDKGQYFIMNPIGSRIWSIIESEIEVKKIINILLEEYEINEKTCEIETFKFLEKLKQAGLVVVK